MTYDNYLKIKKALGRVRLKPLTGAVQKLRAVKDPAEVALIRESVGVLDYGFRKARTLLKPGVVERDAALSIESAFKAAGGDALAFDTIIASGERGALPHGKADYKKIKKGELVVVDMGVLRNGYNSDETRTFCVGKAAKRHREIYEIVKAAQERAIEEIKPGAAAADVDFAARSYIDKKGFGKYFGHGTGHGVGLDIHEGPTVSPQSKDVLQEGMVITIEPGIYIPGWGGVRIEDMALVVKGGFEILTRTPKEFVCL